MVASIDVERIFVLRGSSNVPICAPKRTKSIGCLTATVVAYNIYLIVFIILPAFGIRRRSLLSSTRIKRIATGLRLASSASLLSASTAGPSDNKNSGDSAPNSNCLDSNDVETVGPIIMSVVVGGRAADATRESVADTGPTEGAIPAGVVAGDAGLIKADKDSASDV